MSFTSDKKHRNNTNTLNKYHYFNQSIEFLESCPNLRDILEFVSEIVNINKCTLISGDTGVGKELMARYYHAKSNRNQEPFIALNMNRFSDALLMSELCGHIKGAFTGAITNKDGLLKVAQNGTIFLDEINSISEVAQSKLLRIIEQREFSPVGSNQSFKFNCHILVGSNVNLLNMVKMGSFRHDLYYRVSTFEINIQSFKERKSDIPFIIKNILKDIAEEFGYTIPKLSKQALTVLINYDWPGNGRELYNTLFRAIILSKGQEISSDLIYSLLKFNKKEKVSLESYLNKYEKDLIEAYQLITLTNEETASLLGIPKDTLRDKIRRLGIKTPSKSIRKGGISS